MSNFPLSYRLSWLPRLLKPSLAGNGGTFGPMTQRRQAEGPTIRLVFLGDISAVANGEPPEIDVALREIIAQADLVVGNCESPVGRRPAFPVATGLGTRHAMTPDFLDGVLDATGIQPGKLVLSLANNHIFDQGIGGFDETVSALAERGIATVGTVAGGLVRRVKAGPLTVGLLAFTQWRNGAAEAFAGRVTMLGDIDGWHAQVPNVDLLCAVPHWDVEFRHFPQPETRVLAGRLAKAGAGLIVGGHAHVVQPVDRIGGTLVGYGLGDFLGTALARPPWPLRIGALLSVDIGTADEMRGQIVAYRVVPFLRERRGGHERLVLLEAAGGATAEKAKQRMAIIFGGSGGGQSARQQL